MSRGSQGGHPAGGGEAHRGEEGVVLLPRRCVAGRMFAWLGRFRRLARDYERWSETLAGWHWLAMPTLFAQVGCSPSASLALAKFKTTADG